jgi:hypothetical protein
MGAIIFASALDARIDGCNSSRWEINNSSALVWFPSRRASAMSLRMAPKRAKIAAPSPMARRRDAARLEVTRIAGRGARFGCLKSARAAGRISMDITE